MTRAVGTGLNDMHHAGFAGVTADIERVCSHQNAAHRIDSRVKLYLSHVALLLFVLLDVVESEGEDFEDDFKENFGPVLFFFSCHNDQNLFVFVNIVYPHQCAGEGGYFPERDEDGFVYLSFGCDECTAEEQYETSKRED